MADDKVKVRIKPLHGIGGVGEAGDVVWMSEADAEMYFKDGYVEYVEESDQRSAVSERPAPIDHPIMQSEKPAEDHAMVEERHHDVMKPQAKRSRKK